MPATNIVLGTDYPFAQKIGVATTLAGVERHFGGERVAVVEAGVARGLFPRLLDPGDLAGATVGGGA